MVNVKFLLREFLIFWLRIVLFEVFVIFKLVFFVIKFFLRWILKVLLVGFGFMVIFIVWVFVLVVWVNIGDLLICSFIIGMILYLKLSILKVLLLLMFNVFVYCGISLGVELCVVIVVV